MWNVETTLKNLLVNFLKKIRGSENTGPILSFFHYLKTQILLLDKSILVIYFLLLGIGLVQIYSSSYIYATEKLGNGLLFFNKQLIFSVLAIITMFTTAIVSIKTWKKLSIWMWGICCLLMLLVFVPGIGVRIGGALRWIQLPFGVRLEASELTRVVLPLVLALFLSRSFRSLGKYEILIKMASIALPLLILLKHPDFGSFVICSLCIFCVLFCFGLPWKYIFAIGSTALVSFLGLVWFVPYRKARLMSYLDPWADPMGSSFQMIQSMLSYYNGGATGVGLGQGQGKLFFLPEAHTDFTMAVMGEELGFLGILIILSLYAFVVVRGIQISLKASRIFDKALAIGLSCVFSFQVFINMGVSMGLLPTKGLTMPFLSYGGSSLIAVSFLIGMLLNLDRSINSQNR